MAKRRKTRKEKLSSDTRVQSAHKSQSSTSSSSLFTLSEIPQTAGSTTTVSSIGTSHYSYLTKDLLKTSILTVSIIIAELILKFVVKL